MTQNVKAQTKVLGTSEQIDKDWKDSLKSFKKANGDYPQCYYFIMNKAIRAKLDVEVLKAIKQDFNYLYALKLVKVNETDDNFNCFEIKPVDNKLDSHMEAFATFNLVSAMLSEACGFDMDDIAENIVTVDKDIFVDVRELLCTVKA